MHLSPLGVLSNILHMGEGTMKQVLGLMFAIVILAGSLYAHSGRTDKNGCHHDTKTGTYHCH